MRVQVTRVGLPVATRADLRGHTLEAAVLKDPAFLRARSKLDQCATSLAASRSAQGSARGGGGGSGGGRSKAASGEAQRTGRSAMQRAIEECRAAEFKAAAAHLRAVDVVVCTCVSAGSAALLAATGLRSEHASASGGEPLPAGRAADGGPLLRFASVVLDEATQATEPAALVALALGARQLALVG